MANASPSGERDFAGRGMARIFGAPISWVALFGALMGALSIVPMIFYPFGGGFASAGMVVFGPLSGVILGPWAGAIAGIIGGLIGMFISPASYPLGIVDVFLSGALLPLAWGLAHPRYRKIFIPVYIIAMVIHFVIPYIWPGAAGGFETVSPVSYFLSFIWMPIGFVVYLVAQERFLKAMNTPSIQKRLLFTILYMFAPLCLWISPWLWAYFVFLHYPGELASLNNAVSWYFYILPIMVASGVVAALLVRALEQSGLPRVKGSILDQE